MSVIPAETKIGKYTIKVNQILGMVTVFQPDLLVSEPIQSFNSPADGSFAEIYLKAVEFTNKLAGIVSETQKTAESLIAHEEELTSINSKV